MFTNKKIILGAPKHFNIADMIERELEHIGFEVINISFFSNDFKYKSIFERLKSYYIKNFGGNKYYKQDLFFNRNRKWIQEKVDQIDTVDYALIIRPDVYPSSLLKEIIGKAKVAVGYQWDGLDRFPLVYEKIHLFPKFFVFDKRDLQISGTRLTTNFYPQAIVKDPNIATSDVYYTGSYNKNRIVLTERIIQACSDVGLHVDYALFSRKRKIHTRTSLQITHQQLDYAAVVQRVLHSKIILDIVNPTHEGLSFRVFESIGYEKKLITTNHHIRDFDFYHPHNILIWTAATSSQILATFINQPYHPLEESVKQKYGFKNWITHLLTS